MIPHFVTLSKLLLLAAVLSVLTNWWSSLTSHTLCREAQSAACKTTVGPGLKCDWWGSYVGTSTSSCRFVFERRGQQVQFILCPGPPNNGKFIQIRSSSLFTSQSSFSVAFCCILVTSSQPASLLQLCC